MVILVCVIGRCVPENLPKIEAIWTGTLEGEDFALGFCLRLVNIDYQYTKWCVDSPCSSYHPVRVQWTPGTPRNAFFSPPHRRAGFFARVLAFQSVRTIVFSNALIHYTQAEDRESCLYIAKLSEQVRSPKETKNEPFF